MADPSWVMFRCNVCQRFSGARKGQKSMVCGHCGATDGFSVVQEFSNSHALSQAIALENTPAEIRKELELALSSKPDPLSSPDTKSKDPASMLQSFADEQGIIDIDGLTDELSSSGLSEQHCNTLVNEWLHQSEIEGMVIRIPSGEYRLLS